MRSSYRYALAHTKRPTMPGLRARVAEIFGRLPNGVGYRQIAIELRRRRRADSRQDGPQGDERDVPKVRHTPQDRPPQVQLIQRRGRLDLREHARPRFRGGRPVAEDGHRRHRVRPVVRQGLPRAGLRLREQGDRGALDITASRPRAAGGDAGYRTKSVSRWNAWGMRPKLWRR